MPFLTCFWQQRSGGMNKEFCRDFDIFCYCLFVAYFQPQSWSHKNCEYSYQAACGYRNHLALLWKITVLLIVNVIHRPLFSRKFNTIYQFIWFKGMNFCVLFEKNIWVSMRYRKEELESRVEKIFYFPCSWTWTTHPHPEWKWKHTVVSNCYYICFCTFTGTQYVCIRLLLGGSDC